MRNGKKGSQYLAGWKPLSYRKVCLASRYNAMPAQAITQIADTFEFVGEETIVSMGNPSPHPRSHTQGS